ncbi:peptidase S1 [Photobacterium jeanii]|uniref:Peptidase S1 n=1 Tax=Photobacterium jeanii TaxID=858640 RepID=A0A178K312_9GAMM|nr:peptidase S1 [Photobacterium jeanii]
MHASVLITFFIFSFSTVAALPDTISKVKPAIVGVGIYNKLATPRAQLLGTGFAVQISSSSRSNIVATNAHVVPAKLVKDGKTQFVVFVGTGKNPDVRTATVLTRDSKHDLALLRISGNTIPTLGLATNTVREGEEYPFTGFPIGAILGLYPVTHKGMISSITPVAIPARNAKELSVKQLKQLKNPYMVYQLDATAYPGNSGSPVYHPQSGKVVAIVNKVLLKSTKESALTNPSDITYAIPVKHLQQLINNTL